MQYRILGKTGLKVSEIGMGAWPIAGELQIANQAFSYGPVAKEQAHRALNVAYQLGVNFFDTADFYGLGKSEYLLGEVFKDVDDVIILTKAGLIPDGEYGVKSDLSYHHIMAAAKRSLERLNRKYIDVFLLHVPPKTIDEWEEAREALRELRSSGVIRFSGIAVGGEFKKIVDWLDYPETEVIIVHYNLLFRDYETELLDKVRGKNIGVIAASPLSRGILSKSTSNERSFDDSDVRNRWTKNDDTYSLLIQKREKVKTILSRYAVPLTGTALAFVLREKTIATIIPGMKSPEHVKQNIEEIYGYDYPQDLFEDLLRD